MKFDSPFPKWVRGFIKPTIYKIKGFNEDGFTYFCHFLLPISSGLIATTNLQPQN